MFLRNLIRGIGANDAVDRGGKEPKVNDDVGDLEDKVEAGHDLFLVLVYW